jgi:histone H3/H4
MNLKRKASSKPKEEKLDNDPKKEDGEQKKEDEEVKKEDEEVNVTEPVVLETKPEKVFMSSPGRLRRLLDQSGLEGRVSKDVFDTLDKKIKSLTEQRVKSLVVKDKRIVYDDSSSVEEKNRVYMLPLNPFREYIKSIIKKEHDINRVSPPEIVLNLHYEIEQDVIKLCQYAQDIMNNSTRKTLFANDIEVASKAMIPRNLGGG